MSSMYRNQLENYLKGLTIKADHVLDMGGLQLPIKDRVKSFECNRYAIADLEGGDYKIDLNLEQNPFEFEKKKWDMIFCLEVFEYIWNPLGAMKNLYEWSTDEATIYLTFPTQYPLHNPEGMDYLRYTHNWINKMLEYFKFRDVEITPRPATYRDYIASYWAAEKMHPIKHDDRLFNNGYIVKCKK